MSDLEQRLLEAAKNDWVYIDNRILLQEAADTLAAVRVWAESEYRPADDLKGYNHSKREVLAILDGSDTNE